MSFLLLLLVLLLLQPAAAAAAGQNLDVLSSEVKTQRESNRQTKQKNTVTLIDKSSTEWSRHLMIDAKTDYCRPSRTSAWFL